jgi:putative SOS response-associated peptidase YedK
MCGRFAFFSSHEAMRRAFDLPDDTLRVEPRWNIAPTRFVPVVRLDPQRRRHLAMLYWGLVPYWARDKSIGARLINARAETVAEKPAFRSAFRHRRCLVLADGYYEWQTTAAGKQPWFISRADRQPFAMAGLWESWLEAPGAPSLESCTIVTTAAPPAIAMIHPRVPVVLPATAYPTWLEPQPQDPAALTALLLAPAADSLAATRVGRRVNDARNDGPELIAPLADSR